MRILAVDPGTMTGVALWRDGECLSWQEPLQLALDRCSERIHDRSDLLDEVVSESFTITAKTLKGSQDGKNSIEGIGVLRWLCARQQIPFSTVSPSDAVTFSTNEKLKRAGIYVTSDHERSARRVLLVRLVKTREIDPRSLLSPAPMQR